MNGDFGVFVSRYGSSIGGCLDWEIVVKTKERKSGLYALVTVASWQCKTERWWLLDDVSTATVSLYKIVKDENVLMFKGDLELITDRDELKLDTIMRSTLVMERLK